MRERERLKIGSVEEETERRPSFLSPLTPPLFPSHSLLSLFHIPSISIHSPKPLPSLSPLTHSSLSSTISFLSPTPLSPSPHPSQPLSPSLYYHSLPLLTLHSLPHSSSTYSPLSPTFPLLTLPNPIPPLSPSSY